MQLLVLVLNKVEVLEDLMTQMASGGISGATILSSTGMATALMHSEEEVPMFGILRKVFNPDRVESKTIFTVLRDEQIDTAKEIINRVTGGLSNPNTGILFTLPINSVEGLVK